MQRILSRAATGRVAPRELVQLARGLSRTQAVSTACHGKGCAPLDALLEGVRDCSELYESIRKTLAETPAAMLGKGEVIAAGIDPELDDLRNLSGDSRSYLLAMQEREAERTGISSLKIGFNNVFGY